MKRIFLKLLSPMLIFSLLLAFAFPCFAQTEDLQRTLRVGYIGYEGFIAHNENGEPEGYGVEYLSEIGKYANFDFEYVYCTWADSLEMLKRHEIDLVCTAKYTPQRAQTYDFSTQNFGRVQEVLYTRADNFELYYEDYEHLDGKRIAFLKDSLNIGFFEEYALHNGFVYEPVIYDSDKAMTAALQAGEVDAMVSEHIALHDELRLVASFGSHLYFLMSYKGNDFMDDINYAMSVINTQEYDYEAQLYTKYYGSANLATGLNLTREESDFVANCPTLKVAINVATCPMAYIDESGKISGINIDILQKISQISGLTFEFFPLYGMNSAYDYQYFIDNKIDLIGGIERNKFNENLDRLTLTQPFFNTEKSLAVRQGKYIDSRLVKRIAMVGGSGTFPYVLEESFPGCEILIYSTLDECLAAVKCGKADVTLYNQYVLERSLERPQYEDLSVIPTVSLEEALSISPVSYPYTYGQKAQWTSDERLVNILNKSIRVLSGEDIENIIISNTIAQKQGLCWGDYLYKFRIPCLIVGFLLFACIGLLVSIIYNRQRNLQRMTAKNEQLADAVAQADHANAAKSQFLSRMSHEIRTPMNAIVGITAIARKHTCDSEKTADYLNKIDSSSKVLLNIINDVLDMSAIEAGKLKIAQKEFDIKQILTAISSIYYPQCQAKGVNFIMAADLSDEILLGDSLRISQILLNLVSNAYKFTDAGGEIKILVSQTKSSNNTVFIRFVVADTGCGISPEMLDRLFKPFEQETTVTAQKYGGSGLGMSITKNLTEMMKGALSVESKKGKGTTFTVDLPFKLAGYHADLLPDKLKNLCALIVDDDNHAQEYTAIILERIGIRYEIADSGAKAIEMIKSAYEKKKGYDVCFIDWKMPDLDGVALTKEIRQLLDRETIIIVVSAYDLTQVEEEARIAGADMFISKPLFQSTVFNVLMQLSGAKPQKPPANAKKYDFNGCRVLLAEDNALNAEIATELLSMVNMKLDWARDGKKACELFEASLPGTYDAILMDIQMPGMDGYAATRKIRCSKHPQAKKIPIFAMTANAFTEDVTAALSCGMNGHIAKPIDTALLYQALRDNLSDAENMN